MACYHHISVAVPMTDEQDNLPALLQMLRRQTFRHFTLYCCVNQPELPPTPTAAQQELKRIAHSNAQTLTALRQVSDLPLRIIDRSSPGLGWQGKQNGVGWARKLLMDAILQDVGATQDGQDGELIVSLDADTAFRDDYLQAVIDAMNAHPEVGALCVPYYHPLSGTEATDRAMLRYELYMRHYLLNLLLIHNPYAFSALGSAMAFSARAYHKAGGITPLQGGEDFYLMQKFAKTGRLLLHLDQCVLPQGRVSRRVPFGTGPAIAKGLAGMAASYPFFPAEAFAPIEETFRMFPALYDEERETPMSPFLRSALRTNDLWGPLRNNYKSRERFVHACEERVDGLRILQFLRSFPRAPQSEMQAFFSLWPRLGLRERKDFDFATIPIEELNSIRNELFEKEMQLR